MTRTLRLETPEAFSLNGSVPHADRARRERRGRLMLGVVGVLIMAVAVAAFEVLTPKAPSTRDVLVAARSIRAGEQISGRDLKVISLASPQLAGVPVSSRDQFVGRAAALDIAEGQPLVAADLGGVPGPGPGEAVVGLSLANGRFPSGLTNGDAVAVVDTPGATSASSPPVPPGVELSSGRILSATRSADGSRTEMSLAVPTPRADAVVEASADDSVSLVWVTQQTVP